MKQAHQHSHRTLNSWMYPNRFMTRGNILAIVAVIAILVISYAWK